jgi:hypothetical protein
MRRTLLAAILLFLTACGDAASGLRAYRGGRFEEAHAAFVRATEGADAAPELLHDRALAALRIGELDDADASAERAAAHGDPRFAALRDFVRGNTALARAEKAGVQAALPEAEPFAFDAAIAQAEAARLAWESAAVTRDDWPEARRNVERALRKLDELKKAKADAEKRRKKETASSGKPKPRPVPKPPDEPGDPPMPEPGPAAGRPQPSPQPGAQGAEPPLSAEEVRSLLDRVAAKEREKLALRRARRQEASVQVERDW